MEPEIWQQYGASTENGSAAYGGADGEPVAVSVFDLVANHISLASIYISLV